MLILYFSHSGNTRTLAEYIHSKIGGDLLELKTVTPSPSDYDAVVDQAQQEQRHAHAPLPLREEPLRRGLGHAPVVRHHLAEALLADLLWVREQLRSV